MDDLDKDNKKAPHVNPSRSGVRSGNPQLDPKRAQHEKSRPGQEPHQPEVTPRNKRSPNR